jgi:GNAT superfamily N-acetyltransferase
MYKFSEEAFTPALVSELAPLFEEHWTEVTIDNSIPLDPDYEKLYTLQNMGLLHSLIVRTDEGELVGYMITFLTPHVHYKETMYAQNDAIFIHPSHRKGGLAYKMLKVFEECMTNKGADVLHMHVKVYLDFGSLLDRLGYTHEENIYRKKVR